jgi:integrase/recombinase XerD
MALDIHNFERQYDLALANLARGTTSARNQALIRAFCDACLLRQVCGKVRLIRSVGALGVMAHHLGKDFPDATREDLERLLGALIARKPVYSNETLATYKRILRRFMTYVLVPDQFPNVKPLPPRIAWITTHIRRRDRASVKRSDLLSPADVDALLKAANNERDRAFIASLWEAGPRIAEIGNMQIKHVTRNAYGYSLDITGKTGTRSPLVVSAAPYLSAWIAMHPKRDDPEAPLWVQHQSHEPMEYRSITMMLKRLFHRAGIKKPYHPHIFRHSRVTYVIANAIMNEQQAKTYFGWTPDSDMLGSTYAHLIDTDVNNAILRENNMAPHQVAQRDLQPQQCRICHELSPPGAEYCQSCNAVLDLKKAYEHQQLHDLKEELFARMFKVMVERGLVDEAAKEIHDANLGSVLKRLAQHASGEMPIVKATVKPETRRVNPEMNLPQVID